MRAVVGDRLIWPSWVLFAAVGCAAEGGVPEASRARALNCDSAACVDAEAPVPIGESEAATAQALPQGDSGDPPQDAGVVAACVPQPGADLPDDAFVDSNCDGIDGDKDHAIFVAPTGSDSATGAFGDPVLTLRTAVALAVAAGKDVYACNATYIETLVLTKPVNIYGGYDCANGWQRVSDVLVLSPNSGVPLTVRGVLQPMTVDHAKIVAADALLPGESSIAGLVAASTSVSFHKVTFQAGSGAAGANGAPASAWTSPATFGANGASFTDWLFCLSNPNDPACTTDMAGGLRAGAPGEGPGGQGADGYQNNGGVYPSPPHGRNDQGPIAIDDSLPGLPGDAGAAGAGANVGIGMFSGSGYVASNAGQDGTPGTSGQGGSGGWGGARQDLGCASVCYACAIEVGGGGGQGGFGGAGGAAGHGGGGGGASIGLLSFHSGVALSDSAIDTAAGGRGGNPSAGAPGQMGGAGGAGGTGMICDSNDSRCGLCPNITDNGNPGAAGGAGGKGGPGGPGGGGPSIGVVSVGTGTAIGDSVVLNIGAGGLGGAAIGGATDGPAGPSAPRLDVDVSDAGAASGGH